jgi:hypothetical protein
MRHGWSACHGRYRSSSPTGVFVDRGPCAAGGFPFGHAAMFIAFFDMFSLPLLLAGVRGFIAAGHLALSKILKAQV